ncbi:hypothetical protein HY407_00495 [Candidatus Gottesmanbacteria bacterium]|nr:hypothetical protein [Candidatus Gottesmanbacteria bacterium]
MDDEIFEMSPVEDITGLDEELFDIYPEVDCTGWWIVTARSEAAQLLAERANLSRRLDKRLSENEARDYYNLLKELQNMEVVTQ